MRHETSLQITKLYSISGQIRASEFSVDTPKGDVNQMSLLKIC